jgi:hypothetical protein
MEILGSTHKSTEKEYPMCQTCEFHSLYYRVRFAGSNAAALERLQLLADQGEHVAEAHLAIVLEVIAAVL